MQNLLMNIFQSSNQMTFREFIFYSLVRSHHAKWEKWDAMKPQYLKDAFFEWHMTWFIAILEAFPDEANKFGYMAARYK